MESDARPPYMPSDDTSAAEFFDKLQTSVQRKGPQEFAGPHKQLDGQTERLRAFLRFAIRQDYSHGPKAYLSAEDRHCFTIMNKYLRKLENEQYTRAEKVEMRTYFWVHLRQPCAKLEIPYDYVVATINRFFESLESDGRYKGAFPDLLRNKTLTDVASKIYLDETIIIPAIFALDNDAEREEMLKGTQQMSKRWFATFRGVHGEIEDSRAQRSWRGAQRAQYVLNQGGQDVQVARQRLLDRVAPREAWSTTEWEAMIKETSADRRKLGI